MNSSVNSLIATISTSELHNETYREPDVGVFELQNIVQIRR